MSLTVMRMLPALLLLMTLFLSAAPAYASGQAKSVRPQAPESLSTRRRIELYSPRVRRSTLAYLRLRLLELREEGLDRARAAIERRLSVDELLLDTAPAVTRKSPPQRVPNR